MEHASAAAEGAYVGGSGTLGAEEHEGESAIRVAQQIEHAAIGRGARAGGFRVADPPDYGFVIVGGGEGQRQASGAPEEACARTGGGVAEDHHADDTGENSSGHDAHQLAALLRFGAAFDADA